MRKCPQDTYRLKAHSRASTEMNFSAVSAIWKPVKRRSIRCSASCRYEEQDDKLMITTTDIHLARGIGEALEHAYRGELAFHYNKAEYLLRVRWQR